MDILDKEFKKNPKPFYFQCGLAMITMIGVLLFLDVLTHTALIASLGATVFTVFTMPGSLSARARNLLGGYAIGITCGVVCGFLSNNAVADMLFTQEGSFILFAALSVGAAIFLMVITDTEHAPAAGISLGLVLNPWNLNTIVFIMGAVLFIAIVKKALHSHLKDLI
ncbi:HPP family protein [Elusimicrobiota bacterium]